MAVLAVAALTVAACSSSSGSGAGLSFSGGATGSVCNDQYQGQGCLLSNGQWLEQECQSGKWATVGTCAANQHCVEKLVTGSSKKAAGCVDNPVSTTPTDANGSGTDTAGQDAGGSGDSQVTTDISMSQLLSCLQSKCSAIMTACVADTQCNTNLNCAKSCPDVACTSNCAKVDNAVWDQVGQCGLTNKCFGDIGQSPVCGNGTCESGETQQNCAKDCGGSGPVCGNGACETGESTANCPADCPVVSGDCKSSADASKVNQSSFGTAAQQCTLQKGCLTQSTPAAQKTCISACLQTSAGISAGCASCSADFSLCGVSKCLSSCASNANSAECQSCMATNCGAIAESCGIGGGTSSPVCGNGTCESGETSSNCAADCGGNTGNPWGTPSTCLNQSCDAGENKQNCPLDCDPAAQSSATCMYSSCQSQTLACAQDNNCLLFVNCAMACNAQQACITTCYNKTPSGSKSAAQAIAACGQSSGCISGGSTGPVCGNGKCETGETSSSCPTDCKSAGNIGCAAIAGGTGGCSGCACESCVCKGPIPNGAAGGDSYCCATAWDSTCASECSQCGTCP